MKNVLTFWGGGIGGMPRSKHASAFAPVLRSGTAEGGKGYGATSARPFATSRVRRTSIAAVAGQGVGCFWVVDPAMNHARVLLAIFGRPFGTAGRTNRQAVGGGGFGAHRQPQQELVVSSRSSLPSPPEEGEAAGRALLSSVKDAFVRIMLPDGGQHTRVARA
jgi:hypothetical protein